MSAKPRLLIVDDEPNIRRILEVAFEKAGYATTTAENALVAFDLLSREPFDVVITDVTMPGPTGYKLQEQIKEHWPQIPVIICTAYGTIREAVASIRNGAYDFVTKPFDLENLKKIVKSSLDMKPMVRDSASSPGKKKAKSHYVANSPQMREVIETIEQVADSNATVLISGESGTGKEVVATLLHELSSRSGGNLVACSCAALPETLLESELFGYEKGAFTGANTSKAGRFESANGGTLFLDEIGEVPMSIQAKLLRVLQQREVERLGSTKPVKLDVRLITATNRNLEREVDAGNFRLDLLFRLQVVEIALPPLRERKEDILELANFFMQKYAQENGRTIDGFSTDAEEALLRFAWPGNVRELSNVMERAVVLLPREESTIALKHLSKNIQSAIAA